MKSSAISFEITIKRQLQGYFWQVYGPSFLLSLFGAFSVYVPSDIVPGRMVLSMTSFLALIGLFGSARYIKSKFYKKRGATFFYDITRKLGPLNFTQCRSKSSSF